MMREIELTHHPDLFGMVVYEAGLLSENAMRMTREPRCRFLFACGIFNDLLPNLCVIRSGRCRNELNLVLSCL